MAALPRCPGSASRPRGPFQPVVYAFRRRDAGGSGPRGRVDASGRTSNRGRRARTAYAQKTAEHLLELKAQSPRNRRSRRHGWGVRASWTPRPSPSRPCSSVVALELQDVARKLPAPRVVLDDEDQLVGHGLTGSEKVNVDPWLASLQTQICPPCSSTNFLASVSPSPVPSGRCASDAPTWRNSSKIAA